MATGTITGHGSDWVFRGYDIGRENLETLRATVRKYAAHMDTVDDRPKVVPLPFKRA